jgi:hypothetical protein
VSGYSSVDRGRIDYAWNGKHADQFVDAHQQARWEVVSYCLGEPGNVPAELLEHLFLADAAWTREAWGSPPHFAALGALLLQRGGEAAVETFATGLSASFDTFGACHEIRLSPELAVRLSAVARERAAFATDERLRTCLESAAELLIKVQKGTAQEGWGTVAPNTPVQNVRVIWPRWYHKLGQMLAAWVKRAT